MRIHELLSAATTQVGLEGSDRRAVIDSMVDLLTGLPSVLDLDEVRRTVHAREDVMSTGVGKALALPHGKTDAVSDNVAALAITKEPVDFGALDDQPVRIVFMLIGPTESKSQHIKILSRISRLMNRDLIRNRLIAAQSSEELLAVIADGESALLES